MDVQLGPETDSGIEWAMEDSLERQTGDGFVIFENPTTQCFVQFAHVMEDGIPVLLLDVPHL